MKGLRDLISGNVHVGRADHQTERATFAKTLPNYLSTPMPQQQPQFNALKERQIQLALQALKQDANLSERRAAALYRVSRTTLHHRRARRPSRVDTIANSQNLTNNKEQVIVTHILKLVARGESP